MQAFSERVDLELFDIDFFKLLCKQYELKLRLPLDQSPIQVVPKGLVNFERYLEILKDSPCYDKLVRCLS